MNTRPRVSVVMAIRGADNEFLQKAVTSVLTQTFGGFEFLIVRDRLDAREDDVSLPDDPRIRMIDGPGRGLGAALNLGVREARAPYIARFDADDVCLPNRLALQMRYLDENPNVAVYGSRIIVIDEHDRVIGQRLLPLTHEQIAKSLRRYNCISHPAVMFRREAALAAGGYREDVRTEDYDLWCRMLVHGATFANAAEPLILYRVHDAALKYMNVPEQIRATIEVKKRCFGHQLTIGDRARIWAEMVLEHMPAAFVLWLFRLMTYRSTKLTPPQ